VLLSKNLDVATGIKFHSMFKAVLNTRGGIVRLTWVSSKGLGQSLTTSRLLSELATKTKAGAAAVDISEAKSTS
jgi:hypothetical protein